MLALRYKGGRDNLKSMDRQVKRLGLAGRKGADLEGLEHHAIRR